MSLPNLISIGRLCSAPVIVWLIVTGQLNLAFWVFLLASVSDGVDGYVAKRFNRTTVLGGYLDPIADKTLLVSVYITLGQASYLDLWLVILVVFRDLLIVGGALLFRLLSNSLTMQPLLISKVNTVAQIVLAAIMLAQLGLGLPVEALATIAVYVVAASTLLSGASYITQWSRRAAGLESS